MKNETTGDRIKSLREKKGWTQEMLAEKLNAPQSLVAKVEVGTRKLKTDELVKIAGYFDTSLDYIMGRTDIESSNISVQGMAKLTGLTEQAITVLMNIDEDVVSLIDLLIVNEIPEPDINDFTFQYGNIHDVVLDEEIFNAAIDKYRAVNPLYILSALERYLTVQSPTDEDVAVTFDGRIVKVKNLQKGFAIWNGSPDERLPQPVVIEQILRNIYDSRITELKKRMNGGD